MRKKKRIVELKEAIFNEKFHRIGLKREIEEQDAEIKNVKDDISYAQK